MLESLLIKMKAAVSYRNAFESQCDISVPRLNNKTPIQVNLPLHLFIVTYKQSVNKKFYLKNTNKK